MIDCSLRFQFFMRQAVGMYITWLVADHIVNSKEREPQIILKCVPLFWMLRWNAILILFSFHESLDKKLGQCVILFSFVSSLYEL
jgi:hypothetical protein